MNLVPNKKWRKQFDEENYKDSGNDGSDSELFQHGIVSTAMAATAVAQDDLLQDAGSWAQVVGESSLKVADPSLEKGRI